jgi:uncharacterized protein (TIGR03382 family)
MWMSAAAILAVAGSAMGSIVITPSDVLTWGGLNQGRSLAAVQPSGLTWAWTNSQPSQCVIDSNGRVYFQGQYTQSPPVGTITAGNHRAIFSATNSADLSVFSGLYDGGTYGAYNLKNAAGSVGGISTTPPRISGTAIGLGLQISGAGIIETGTGTNNSVFAIGNSGGVSTAAQQFDSITLNDTNGNATATNISTALKSISQQNSEINSSGTMLAWMAVPTAAGTGSPLVGQFVSTANAVSPAPRGNTAFLATKTVGGGYTVIAQGGQAAPGVSGGFFQNGNNGVNGFFSKLNRNGQVAFDGKLVTSFPVTTSSDDVAYIYTPGSGTTLIRREGQVQPDGTGAPDAGGALFSGGITTASHGFSNAGLLFGSSLTGGDVVTTAGSANDSAMYFANTSGTIRIARRNDPVPGAPANTNFGIITTASMSINNGGTILANGSLQGSAVTANVAYQWNQFGDGLIVSTGVMGSDSAVFAGTATAGGLRIIARQGFAAPGTDLYFGTISTNGTFALNNNGDMLFSTDTTRYAAGATIGVVGMTPAASVLPGGPTVLWAYSDAYGLLPMVYSGQSVEVETGVFKTISQFNVMATDNGDGGSSGLNDNGTFALKLTFTDSSWAVVTRQIPAPGTGAIALLGLGVMGRRRRN